MLSLQKTFSVLCLVALTSRYLPGAQAQAVGVPICVETCIGVASVTAGCTDLTDTSCFCNSQTFIASAKACVAKCSTAEQADAATDFQQICGTSLASGQSATSTTKAASTAVGTTPSVTTLPAPLSVVVPTTNSVQTQGVESQVTVGPAGTSGLPGLKNGDKVFLKTLSILRVGLASLGLIAGGIFLY